MPLPPGLPSTEGPPLTSESRSHGSLLFGLVADPLLAALSRKLHSAWVGAVRAGQADIHAAEGHAAHRPIQAGALVLAAALEGLAAPVHHAAEDARGAVPSCEGQEAEGEPGGRAGGAAGSGPAFPFPSPAGPRPCPPGRRQPPPPLTGADADPAVGGGAEVAEEPFVVVAGVALGAELAQLLGADAAAAAAVGHQGDAGGAGGAGPRAALALPAALLALRLLRAAGERERGVRAAAGTAPAGAGVAAPRAAALTGLRRARRRARAKLAGAIPRRSSACGRRGVGRAAASGCAAEGR